MTGKKLPTSREAGFTLIELLASLFIMSLILASLVGALNTLSRRWNSSLVGIDRLDMASRAADILRRDISSLQRVVSLNGGTPKYIFSGSSTGLLFVTLEPAHPTAPGAYLIRYARNDGSGNFELTRSRTPYRSKMRSVPPSTRSSKVPLLEGPYDYRFSYAAASSDDAVWKDRWSDPKRLPRLIRLQILDRQSGGAVFPPIVAAVKSDAEPSCLAEGATLCSARTGGELKISLEADPASKYKKR